jgi:hypothetical protein
MWKEVVVVESKYSPGICLEGLRKDQIEPRHYSMYPECKCREVLLHNHSVIFLFLFCLFNDTFQYFML